MRKLVVDENGNETFVDYTDDEIAELSERHSEFLNRKAEIMASEAKKITAKATLLTKLGITEEEAKLLLS